MPIPQVVRRQRDFTGGELDPNAERRSDLDIFDRGLKRARNARPGETGSLRRRPGRRAIYFDGGLHDRVRPVSTTTFDVMFADQRFTARLPGGGIVANITGCPWTEEDLAELSWEAVDRRIYVATRGMRPHYLEYDPSDGTWSLSAFSFQVGFEGRVAAPFHRFAATGVTLQPSARAGAITLTASEPVFEAGHVGLLFVYLDKQVMIESVTSATVAEATVVEELPPTFRVTLDSVDGFVIGQTIESDDTNTVGEIVGIDTAGSTLDIIASNNYSGFDVDEVLVGAHGRGTVSASVAINPGATLVWREQFMSDLRGWPGSVAFDAQRLVFCDFPQFENAVLESAISAEEDFDTLRPDADAAIFTYVPKSCRVFQIIGGPDQFVITDVGVFYIPVSEATPLTQANARFRPISSDAAANVRAVPAGSGVLYIGADATTLNAIYPTGQTAAPYAVAVLNDYHRPLFTAPISIAVGEGSADAPRAIYVVNDGGLTLFGHYRPGDENVGWFPWESEGMVTAVAAGFGSVLFAVTYDSGVKVVEELQEDMPFDGSVVLSDFSGTDAIQTSTGVSITTSTGAAITTVAGALIPFAAETMFGWGDGLLLGEIAVDADGFVVFPTGYEERIVGWAFEPDIEPFIPTFEGGQDFGQADRRRRIARVAITYRDSTAFLADGHEIASREVGEDWGEPPPERDETYRYRRHGRSFDPTISITQPHPGKLTIIEIMTKVTV